MNYVNAFLFAGIGCLIAQIILDNTKLTPGHITSFYTVVGAFLSFLGIYDNLIMKFGAGATVLISNFGHSLFSSAWQGYNEEGILGIFSNLFCNSSAVIASAIIFAFLFTLVFKAKD